VFSNERFDSPLFRTPEALLVRFIHRATRRAIGERSPCRVAMSPGIRGVAAREDKRG
jgi:hypothetical protein